MKLRSAVNVLGLGLIAAAIGTAVVVASRNRAQPIPLVIKSIADLSYSNWPTSNPATAPSVPTPENYPIDKASGLLFLPVMWAGKPACFLVDTGSATNAVDPAVFGPLPNPRQRPVQSALDGRLIGGTATTFCDPPKIQVGPFELQNGGRVALLDALNDYPEKQPPVIGIIGMPSLIGRTLQLDFVHQQFRFLTPSPAPHTDWGSPVPLIDLHRGFAVSIRSADQQWAAIIDTGCGVDGCIQSGIYDRLTQAQQVPGSRMLMVFGPTQDILRAKLLASLTFAGDVGAFEDITMYDNQTGTSLLGMPLLARAAMVTLDPVNQVMYVLRR